MKKINRIIRWALLFTIFFTVRDVRADTLEKLRESRDCNAIYDLADEIVEFVNAGPVSSSQTREITMDDIDFDNATKEYLDTPLFKREIIKSSDILEVLNKSTYIWIIPIRVDDVLYEAGIAKASDIEGEKTGPWGVEWVYGYEPNELTLEEQLHISLERNNIRMNDYKFYMVGGVVPVRQPIFIALDDEKASYVIPARLSAAVLITDSRYPREASDTDNMTDVSYAEGFQAYSYESVMKAGSRIVNSILPWHGCSEVIDIGKKPPYGLYIRGGLCVIIVVIIIRKVRRRRSSGK